MRKKGENSVKCAGAGSLLFRPTKQWSHLWCRKSNIPECPNRCSWSARSNFSGAIEGRPILAYSLLNRDLSCCSASSVMARSGRNGWSCGTRCSGMI